MYLSLLPKPISKWISDVLIFSEFINIVSIIILYTFLVISSGQCKKYNLSDFI